MPRWNIFTTSDLLSKQEKRTIADQVTKIYTSIGFPCFWVNVIFEELPVDNFYNGGETPSQSVFFYISHAAKGFDSEEERLNFHKGVDEIVRPILEPKGLHWEYNIHGYPPDNWRISGMEPPLPNGENKQAFKLWQERNEAIPYGKYLKN